MPWNTANTAPPGDTAPVSMRVLAARWGVPPADPFAADVAAQAARAVWSYGARTLTADVAALVWAAVSRTLTADPGAAAHAATQAAVAATQAAVAATQAAVAAVPDAAEVQAAAEAANLVTSAGQPERLERVEKLLRNKQISDPATGLSTIYEDDGTTPWLQAPIKEDAAATQAYRRQGIDRRERYVAP